MKTHHHDGGYGTHRNIVKLNNFWVLIKIISIWRKNLSYICTVSKTNSYLMRWQGKRYKDVKNNYGNKIYLLETVSCVNLSYKNTFKNPLINHTIKVWAVGRATTQAQCSLYKYCMENRQFTEITNTHFKNPERDEWFYWGNILEIC